MFNRILVAVDNSEDSRYVFETALFLAKAADARLMLLHVLSSEETGYAENCKFSDLDAHSTIYSEVQVHPKEWQDDKAKGWKILQSFQATATTRGITADLAQPVGNPSRVLPDEGCKWGADLIVIGCGGLIGLNKAILDNVNNYVPHHAPYSILIVPHQAYLGPDESQDNPQQVKMVT